MNEEGVVCIKVSFTIDPYGRDAVAYSGGNLAEHCLERAKGEAEAVARQRGWKAWRSELVNVTEAGGPESYKLLLLEEEKGGKRW